MSPGDDDDGDRTVFRPNPGGRRTSQPARGPGPPAPPSAAGASGGEEWIASRSEPRGPALPSAQVLRFDELVAPSANPILRSAGPLLLLLGRLRVAALQASFASLMEQVAQAVQFFEKEIRQAGVSPDAANTAKYLICATADDIVQNIPTEDRHVWTHYSMLSRFFGERIGGVRFFEELDRLLVDPAANYDVLELQHACLALGFQGRYRSDPNGMSTLQTRQRNLYETLRRIRARASGPLSPHWEGQKLALKRHRVRIPTWAVIGVLAALTFGSFLLLRVRITAAGDAIAAATRAIHPETPIALQRRVPSPPPPPTAPQIDQLGRIRAELAPEISSGALTVDLSGRWIVIRVGSLILFDSGRASVRPEFDSIARTIAAVVQKEAGPVRIVGHTDNVPLSAANRFGSNLNLSVERAKAVAALLEPLLTEPSRIAVEGKGPDEPIASNATAEGRARNRRVEVLVTRAD
jgi:type VI secretion system protein ImpK